MVDQPGQSLCSRKGKRLDVYPLLQREVEPHGPAAAWLRKLGVEVDRSSLLTRGANRSAVSRLGSAKKWRGRLGSFPCSPNAHTRMG